MTASRTVEQVSAFDLSGRTVLVTGASKGLGRALSEALAARGANLALCARGEAGLREVEVAVSAAGGGVLARPLDISVPGAVRELAMGAAGRWGGVDVLVNNASLLGSRADLADQDIAEWRRVLDVNLTGALLACQAVLPLMRRAGAGSIINVTSGVGNEPRRRWGAYAVSKWALEALTWNLAAEEEENGIRVNAVDPGRMATAMRRAAYPDEDPASLPDPSSAVDIFLWLASDRSRGFTGRRFRAEEGVPDG